MARRIADPQRGRCYRFEQFWLPKGPRMDLEEMRELVARVYADLGLDPLTTPDVREGRGGATSYWNPSSMTIMMNWPQRQIVLHETAHSLVDLLCPHLPSQQRRPHGAAFVTVNLELALAYGCAKPGWSFDDYLAKARVWSKLEVLDEPVLRARFEKHAWRD